MSLRLAIIEATALAHNLPSGTTVLARTGRAKLIGNPGTPTWAGKDVVLIGWAFRRSDFAPCQALANDEISALIRSGGAWALDSLWGQYLLCWSDPAGQTWLLRSPVDGPPLFHGASPRGACAFTDLALARELGFARGGPSAQAVDAALRFPFLRTPVTELAGVREILPGEIVDLPSARRHSRSWTPWDHIGDKPRRIDPEALRSMVTRVVAAWGGRFDRIQLELSGGLDSSIVAACLSGRTGAWRGLTLATRDPDGDERPYARAVAARA